MRLIDADKIDFNEVFKGASDFARDTREAAQMLIDNQPTAYNVDKVVEQLQHPTNYTIVCGKHHTTVERAVEIVKVGGAHEV